MAPPDSLPQTKSVVSRVFSDVLSYSKLAGSIPDEDYSYNLAFPEFRKHVREESGQLIQLMGNCCRLLPKRRRLTLTSEESDNKTGAPLLTEEQRSAAMEALDSLLEHVDTVLDEVRGQRMNAEEQLSVSFGSALGDSGQALPDSRSGGRDALRLARVMRPQLTFSAPVDNSAKPFIPHYHDARGVRHTGKAGVHPFEKDIRVFQVPAEQMLPNETPYAPLAQSPFSFIDDREGLERAVQELLQVSEIAVDLEHHDFYSYQGFTCLMQISSRSADYIIDCLKIRDDMHLLAPVFLNPKTLKVLHGAREDIRWLQKDFGLYLVNFFDTAVALQALHMPYSLAFAVDHFCQVKLQKQYQTADWRVRPIPAEMAHYAREDTHYLLYVYDRLKALLLNSEGRASVGNLLVHVYAESQRLSLDVYAKPTLDPQETYKLAMGRSLAGLNPSQEAVARAIFNWRDAAAREADDSPTAILHLSSVLSIASKLPTSARDVLKCCAPVSAVVRTKVAELVDLVKEAAGEAAMEAASLADGQAATEGASSSVGSLLRRTSIHRPRTGTLPSIEIPAHPPLPLTEKLAPLGAQKPSTWFGAMQRLSNIIAATPSIRVQMPGSLVVASLRQAASTKKTTAEARPTTAAPPPTSHKEEDEADEPIPAKSDAAAPAAAPVEPPMALPEEAIALRKVYGTGQSNRKRARKAS